MSWGKVKVQYKDGSDEVFEVEEHPITTGAWLRIYPEENVILFLPVAYIQRVTAKRSDWKPEA